MMIAACGHPAARPPSAPVGPALPRLLPPLPVDPAARGAAYLNQVALQLQPGWGQFLDDCRLRLPRDHALNDMALAATAQLTVDAHGKVENVELTGSGNADFDRAVRDAISDATPLPVPPPELWSDDDRVHLRWLFARDRRQAGPATAAVVDVELPVTEVVARWTAAGDLARAARRLQRVGEEEAATLVTPVMQAAIIEALGSADGATRRAAVAAIGRVRLPAKDETRRLLATTTDAELRLVSIATAAALEDHDAEGALLAALPGDLPDHPRLAIAEARALVALGRGRDVTAILEHDLATGPVHPIALAALAVAPAPGVSLATYMSKGDARTRAGVCAALEGSGAWSLVEQGLRDPDATVRTACIDATRARAGDPKAVREAPRLRALVHDHDRTVRAHALAAIGAVDPGHVVGAVADPAAEVRAAFAGALATALPGEAHDDLRVLIDDRDPDVRAAAWSSLVRLAAAPGDRAQLALHAIRDAAPQVRLAALAAVDDDDALAQLAASDDSPDVRTAAIVQLAGRRGRAAVQRDFLGRLAAAPLASGERVRIALAWLLAR